MVGRYDVSQVKGVESQYAAATNGGAGIKGQISVYLGNGAVGGVTPSQITAVVHDGITPGGHKLQRADGTVAYSRLTSVPSLVVGLATVSGSGILGVSSGALSLLSSTATGTALLTAADPAAARSTLGLGAAALLATNTPGGTGVLDAGGKWPISMIPALALNQPFPVADQTARLALSSAAIGSIAIQADNNTNYVLSALPASTNANWLPLASAGGAVSSVFGKTGAVTGAALDTLAGPLVSTDLLVVRDISANADGTVPVSQLLSLVPAGISLSSTTPSPLGTAAVGSGTTAARSNHVHAHGDQLGGTLHAAATTVDAGFMSSADKTKLDGIAVGATQTPLASAAPGNVGTTAAVGVGTSAARADHVHALTNIGGVSETIGAEQAVSSTYTLPLGATAALPLANNYRVKLTGNATVTLPSLVPTVNTAVGFTLRIEQDATGGRTLAVNAPAGYTLAWDGGSFPAPASAANSFTFYTFIICAGETRFIGVRGIKTA